MEPVHHWQREPRARLEGSRDLDSAKVQAPCVVQTPGGFRLFYTAIGPAKPFATCQGYILSAHSSDGIAFQVEDGIRVAPQPTVPHMSLRVLAPTVTPLADGRWRMYFESRGSADRPTEICSAVSADMLDWQHEDGIRLAALDGVGGPRYLPLPDGRGRLYCFSTEKKHGRRVSQTVISAITFDGLNFELEAGHRLRDKQSEYDGAGITAAEVMPPTGADDRWKMVYSAWQDVPPGTAVPPHPSQDPNTGPSIDFAAASIASDMAGYRSRIFMAYSNDGLTWEPGEVAIEGEGYDGDGLDAVHAEDMSVVRLDDGRYRMYYAACDAAGTWRIASAVTEAGGS